MNLITFAPTTNLLVMRDPMARTFPRRAFFMLHSQVTNDISVAYRLERKPYYPHLNFSHCDGFVVGGKGGNRFFNLLPTNNKSKMSNSTTRALTPAQENFCQFYFHPQAASEAAKALRQVVADALQEVASEGLVSVLTQIKETH